MTATDAEIANESVDLLSQLIRNECVNDGTPESGFESRSVDLLAQYLGDTGLDLERYVAQPGRENLVARIEGSDPTAPTLLLMGHTDVVPANPDGWQRDPFGGEVVDGDVWGRGAVDMLEPHRDDGRRVPRTRAFGLPAARHARLSRGGRRGEPRHVGRRAPARPRARRGDGRLRRDRGRRASRCRPRGDRACP